MIHLPTTSYKGFEIDRFNNIYKDGKAVFPELYCYDIEMAKARIDASLAHKLAQMPDKQAALKKLAVQEGYVEQEAQDFEDKVNNYWERENEPDL